MSKLNIILVGLLLISIWFGLYQMGKSKMYERQVAAFQSENIQYRTEAGKLVSERLAFEGERSDLKGQIDLLKKQGDTITSKLAKATLQIHYLKRKIELFGAGDVVPVPADTVWKVGEVAIDTPLITIDTANQYHSFKFAGNAKRYAYQVTVQDNSELVLSKVKNGTLVRLVNHNPHIVSSEVTSLIVPKNKQSTWSKVLWFAAGFGAASIAFR